MQKKDVTVALIKPDVVEAGKVDQMLKDVSNIESLLHYIMYTYKQKIRLHLI